MNQRRWTLLGVLLLSLFPVASYAYIGPGAGFADILVRHGAADVHDSAREPGPRFFELVTSTRRARNTKAL